MIKTAVMISTAPRTVLCMMKRTQKTADDKDSGNDINSATHSPLQDEADTEDGG